MSDVAFILIDPPNKATSLVKEWQHAFAQHLQPKDLERFTFVETRLSQLQAESADHATFDCIVSPANSYGIMDGGFDYYLSKALSPPGDFLALTRLVQAAIRKRYYGFAPPGSCILVPGLPPNDFACKTIAVCPTMRYPENITWHKDIVYNTMWSLLVELEHWNKRVSVEDRINRVVMSGLGTGAGRIPATECARQMALAVKHFLYGRREEGDGEEDIFSWDKALGLAEEV
ncbi:macro domain-like protein [Boletus reticuloceps]|uniref:Macro domain-like protein n=1 Tax=Boletus reticuloceps TaxID=495285 RepID=A0A8I2YMM1_9AGAM|nr:macro domain-like protein [Boletus reticuloceps]